MTGFLTSPVSAAIVSETTAPSTNAKDPTKEQINVSLNEFNSLSRKEKKERIKEVKSLVKKLKADKKAGKAAEGETSTVLLVILAILIPPLAVYLHENEVNSKFWISLVLTLLFWVPGVIYALLVVLDAI